MDPPTVAAVSAPGKLRIGSISPRKTSEVAAAAAEAAEAEPTLSDPPQTKPKIVVRPRQRPLRPNLDGKERINLEDYQTEHVETISKIFTRYPVAIDLSMLGSGKTYTGSHLGLHHPLEFRHVIVICPLSLLSKWEYMAETYGLPLTVETYNGTRAVKCKQPKHGLLERRDYTMTREDGIVIDRVDFTPTSLYQRMIVDGTLLIIDEFQHIKNSNAQYDACQAFIRAIVGDYVFGRDEAPRNFSRVLLMSGSPVDKEDQIAHMFRLISIMKQDRLSQPNPFIGENTWLGFLDIYNFISYVCSDRPGQLATTAQVDEMTAIYDIQMPMLNHGTAKQFRQICYKAFQGLIKPVLSSSMKIPPGLSNILKFNAFYDIHDTDDQELLTEAVARLSRAIPINDGVPEFGHNAQMTLRLITSALNMIETAKIGTMVRVARARLAAEPNLKMVICVNYSLTIEDLERELAEYRPLIMNGKTKDKDRGQIVRKFGEDNNDHRLLLANLKVCSTGIDLDDKFGHRPRFCIVSPNYSSIDLYQLSHRFMRMDTKSTPTVHMMYGKHASEFQILAALSRKAVVMKQTTHVQAEAGVVFPCDYPVIAERCQDPERAATLLPLTRQAEALSPREFTVIDNVVVPAASRS